MAWTKERTDKLIKMWRSGSSASEIAKSLGGVSRNAVLSKAKRLDITYHSSRGNLVTEYQTILVSTPISYTHESGKERSGTLLCLTAIIPGSANWLNEVLDRIKENPPNSLHFNSAPQLEFFEFLSGTGRVAPRKRGDAPAGRYTYDEELCQQIQLAFEQEQAGIYYGSIETITKGLLEGGANGIKAFSKMGNKTFRVGLARWSGCVFFITFSASSGISAGEKLPEAISALHNIGSTVVEWIMDEQPTPINQQSPDVEDETSD